MIAYRAETALVGLLRKHLTNKAEARALIRELFVSGAHLKPDDTAGTLTIRIHRMASPVHDRAITLLLDQLSATRYGHPETGHRFIYQLVWPTQPDLNCANSFSDRIRMSEFRIPPACAHPILRYVLMKFLSHLTYFQEAADALTESHILQKLRFL